MKESKKPDQVVYNEATQRYDAFAREHMTSLSAPKIELPDVVSWKSNNIYDANKFFAAGFEELENSYKALMKSYQNNIMLYDAKYSFEPIIGNDYYLYKREDKRGGSLFLSLLKPNECSFNYVGTFRLNSSKVWEEV